MHKYKVATHKTNEFVDYTADELLKLMDSNQSNGLERSDFKNIIREILYRNKLLEANLAKF